MTLPELFDKLLPVVSLIAGSGLTYYFGIRQDRQRRDREKDDDIEKLKCILSAELSSIEESLKGRISGVERLIAKNANGGTFSDFNSLQQLYQVNQGHLGLLDKETAAKLISVYASLKNAPHWIIVKKGHPGVNWPEEPKFVADPSDPALKSILEGHKSLLGEVQAALAMLA